MAQGGGRGVQVDVGRRGKRVKRGGKWRVKATGRGHSRVRDREDGAID